MEVCRVRSTVQCSSGVEYRCAGTSVSISGLGFDSGPAPRRYFGAHSATSSSARAQVVKLLRRVAARHSAHLLYKQRIISSPRADRLLCVPTLVFLEGNLDHKEPCGDGRRWLPEIYLPLPTLQPQTTVLADNRCVHVYARRFSLNSA